MTTRPEPTDDVRSTLEDAVRELGATLSERTKLLWLYTQIRLNGRTREGILDEWKRQSFTRGELAEDRLTQDMDGLGTLLGERGRESREVIGRFVARKDFQALKERTADDSATRQFLEEFEAWADTLRQAPTVPAGPATPAEVGGINVEDIVRLLAARKNIVLEGVPGTGKTHVVQAIAKRWQSVTGRSLLDEDDGSPAFRTMVMHPSTSYEDFLEGIRPGGSEPTGGGRFDRVVPDISPATSQQFAVGSAFFKDVCRAAAADKDSDVLVLLDELNRCNVSSVLGDLMLALEPSKRAHWSDRAREGGVGGEVDGEAGDWTSVYKLQLPYSKQVFFVPDNVHVIATTNTTDRSVAPLDAAIRRRFAFVRLEPNFESCGDNRPPDSPATLAVAGTVEILSLLNERVLRPALGPDALLGHSYAHSLNDHLKSNATAEVAERAAAQTWEYDILPQLIDNVRSLGAEDLLHPARSREWLAERPEVDKNARGEATDALARLHNFLRELGLALQVTGTGLSRSVRIRRVAANHAVNSDAGTESDVNESETLLAETA